MEVPCCREKKPADRPEKEGRLPDLSSNTWGYI